MGPAGPFDLILFLLPTLLANLPWVAGVILALVTWRRHPRVSLAALLGFGIMIAASVGLTAAQHVIIRGAAGGPNIQLLQTITYARVFFHVIGGALVVVAVFAWRQPARPTYRRRDEDAEDYPPPPAYRRDDDPGIRPA